MPVTAGIAEATELRGRDELIREAGLALVGAKRIHQDAAIYGPDMETVAADGDHDERPLASALAMAVDAKDSYTRSHCQTVSQLCAVIAAELDLDGDRVARVRLAGLLHDVGKIGVPDAILNKPAALTDEEFEQMKRHSLLGCDIVEAAEMHEEARWVRHHHERFDGTGYPDGLAGEEIPLESRIILVADAFEAMTSDRPYRRGAGPGVRGRRAGAQRRRAVRPARRSGAVPGARPRSGRHAPWHFLNFLPEPHQHGSLRPSCSCSSTRRCCTTGDGSPSASTP